MELPVIIEWVRSFTGGFSLVSANLNPYSEKYNDKMEDVIAPYINKKYNTFTITSNINEEVEGMKGGQYIFIGDFVQHPKFGHQFKAEFYYQDVPATEEGLIAFLMTLPNIKEKRSQAIVAKFGIKGTFDVLDNNINKLLEISGITTQRLPAIQKVWEQKKYLRELYEFFLSKGMSAKLADAAYKKWGIKAKSIIENNPYQLVELRGIGFIIADQEAHKIMEVVPDGFRTMACIKYVLQESLNKNSNLCIPYSLLKDTVLAVIKKCDETLGNDTDTRSYLSLISKILKDNLDVFSVVKDIEDKTIYVYLRSIWQKELFVAKNLYARHNSDNRGRFTEVDISKAERGVSKFNGREIVLDESQKKAIKTVFDNKVSIITGPGGSGKSMICRCVFELAQEKGLTIRMMSPTGKAAQVLESKTGCGASTIHRGLKMIPGDDLPKENITEDILLVDEISMCGIDTMYAMLKAMEDNGHGNIVFVGDKNQLPSVSPGNFLSDIIASGCANVVTLDKIHRQSEGSYISLLANQISQGKVVAIPAAADDITWKELKVDTFNTDIIAFLDKYLASGNSMDDLQIISPMKKGICGVFKINEIIQDKMRSINNTTEQCLQRGFSKFYVGDRVIQVENDYEKMVFNGDMGTITDLGEKVKDPKSSDKKERFMDVSFYGNTITYYGDEVDNINLAWCITVHKFQGSQAKNIVFVMASEAQIMMSKELVYTAFTRAEKKLDIFGHTNMLRISPTKSVIRKRYTNFQKIVDSFRNKKKLLDVLGTK